MTTVSLLSFSLSLRLPRIPGRATIRTILMQRRDEAALQSAVERMASISPHLLDDIGLGMAAGLPDPPSAPIQFGRT
ncbi:hypothetical protein [Albidovulum sediminis]|uniref:DUF1127 domain-containing protein n=1 Tax=Albidovulum sediminis TaxID=3066345 RepID=A0ABT2NPJ1_9RHOB|nr:hypothetical protein [Defluviimonas sediminis]MCT8330804.1 hypothetical protein [Defluviimonas sediminis]